jgi:hypothetical protein
MLKRASSMPSAELMHRSIIMEGSFPQFFFTSSMLNDIFAALKQVSKVIRNGAARTHMNEDTTLLDIVDKGFSLSVDQVASCPSSSELVMLSSYSRTFVPDGTWRRQGILVFVDARCGINFSSSRSIAFTIAGIGTREK